MSKCPVCNTEIKKVARPIGGFWHVCPKCDDKLENLEKIASNKVQPEVLVKSFEPFIDELPSIEDIRRLDHHRYVLILDNGRAATVDLEELTELYSVSNNRILLCKPQGLRHLAESSRVGITKKLEKHSFLDQSEKEEY